MLVKTSREKINWEMFDINKLLTLSTKTRLLPLPVHQKKIFWDKMAIKINVKVEQSIEVPYLDQLMKGKNFCYISVLTTSCKQKN